MTVHSVGLLLENAHRLISYVFTGMYTSNKHFAQSTRHDYGSFPDVKQYFLHNMHKCGLHFIHIL